MHKLFVIALAVGIAATARADSAKMRPGHYPDKAALWKKYNLKDIALGTELFKVAGFTCEAQRPTDDKPKYRRTCVKFIDERCKGRPTKIGSISTSADLPPGQTCFLDTGMGGTYLDRKFVSPSLSMITIVGTDTTAPVIYEIDLVTVPADDLTDTTNLGKALLAKYGRPTYVQPPTQMTWTVQDVRVNASCRSTQGPTGEMCQIRVSDDALLTAERSIQEAADDARKHQQAPAAPSL